MRHYIVKIGMFLKYKNYYMSYTYTLLIMVYTQPYKFFCKIKSFNSLNPFLHSPKFKDGVIVIHIVYNLFCFPVPKYTKFFIDVRWYIVHESIVRRQAKKIRQE